MLSKHGEETVSDITNPSAFNKSAIFATVTEPTKREKKKLTNAERIQRARER
jgi:hypothetical protein